MGKRSKETGVEAMISEDSPYHAPTPEGLPQASPKEPPARVKSLGISHLIVGFLFLFAAVLEGLFFAQGYSLDKAVGLGSFSHVVCGFSAWMFVGLLGIASGVKLVKNQPEGVASSNRFSVALLGFALLAAGYVVFVFFALQQAVVRSGDLGNLEFLRTSDLVAALSWVAVTTGYPIASLILLNQKTVRDWVKAVRTS